MYCFFSERHRRLQPILVILFRTFGLLAPEDFSTCMFIFDNCRQSTTLETKDRAPQSPLKTGDELGTPVG